LPNFGFIIDNRRCIGCHACTVACKSEHEVPIGVNRTWVKYIEKGTFPDSRRLFSVMRCNHCDDAPCVEICPVTALFRRDDGIVDFDGRRCIGCRACMQACPYDALYIDPETRTAAKCNYCAHRVDIGLEPACVVVCPTQAIISGDLDDPRSAISQLLSRETTSVRKPEKATLPRLYYINGDRTSLDPTATSAVSSSMWSRQTRGVGHFAAEVESQVAAIAARRKPESGFRPPPRLSEEETSGDGGDADGLQGARRSEELLPAKVISRLHPLDELRDALGLSDPVNGVLNPDKTNPKHVVSTEAVQTEIARRSYDAPNKGVLWGWQVSAYVWTKAISAGTALFASIASFVPDSLAPGEQWTAWIVAVIFLAVTGGLLVMDLDQPGRFLNVLFRPQWRSWLVRGAWIINAYAMALGVWLLAMLFGDGLGTNFVRALVIPTSLLTAVYTAFLFAQARGRDYWQSPLLSVHMIVHAMIAGSAVVGMLTLFSGLTAWSGLAVWLLAAGLVTKMVVDWMELALTHGTVDSRLVAKMITQGRFRAIYWGGVVTVGALLPLLLLAIWGAALLPLAGLMALTGLYLAEHILVRAPQLIPLS
jgi:Fe-S-cluster-containing dehydrogenase component/formate-dependent nitrite reductase membrane component NrfD